MTITEIEREDYIAYIIMLAAQALASSDVKLRHWKENTRLGDAYYSILDTINQRRPNL